MLLGLFNIHRVFLSHYVLLGIKELVDKYVGTATHLKNYDTFFYQFHMFCALHYMNGNSNPLFPGVFRFEVYFLSMELSQTVESQPKLKRI